MFQRDLRYAVNRFPSAEELPSIVDKSAAVFWQKDPAHLLLSKDQPPLSPVAARVQTSDSPFDLPVEYERDSLPGCKRTSAPSILAESEAGKEPPPLCMPVSSPCKIRQAVPGGSNIATGSRRMPYPSRTASVATLVVVAISTVSLCGLRLGWARLCQPGSASAPTCAAIMTRIARVTRTDFTGRCREPPPQPRPGTPQLESRGLTAATDVAKARQAAGDYVRAAGGATPSVGSRVPSAPPSESGAAAAAAPTARWQLFVTLLRFSPIGALTSL